MKNIRWSCLLGCFVVCGCQQTPVERTPLNGNAVKSNKDTVTTIAESAWQMDRQVRQYNATHNDHTNTDPLKIIPAMVNRRLTPMESFQLQRQMAQYYATQSKPAPKDWQLKVFKGEY